MVSDAQPRTYSVSVKSLGGTQAEAVINGTTTIPLDKPVALGGTGAGPASFDLLTTGLAD